MRPVPPIPAERLILGASGAMLLASAGLAGRLAVLHMEALGEICGASLATPHCGWCLTASVLALAGAAASAAAMRRGPRLRPLAVRPSPVRR